MLTLACTSEGITLVAICSKLFALALTVGIGCVGTALYVAIHWMGFREGAASGK